MTLVSLLKDLKSQEIKLTLEGELLQVKTPDGVQLSETLGQEIEKHQTDLIKILSRSKKRVSQNSIKPIPRTNSLPLSLAQEGVWYLEQLTPGTASYNMSQVWRFEGALDQNKLKKALLSITERHETLRTAFVLKDDRPILLIHPDSQIDFESIDLSAINADDQQRQLEELIKTEKNTPFDLTHSPLLRVRLYQLAANVQYVQFVMHHIIGDAWSMSLLFKEICTLYAGKQALPRLPVQYADFASWQREQLQSSRGEQSLAHWHKQLKSAPPLLELPTDFQRPAVLEYQGDTVRGQISAAQLSKLTQLNKSENSTPFMVLLALFKILMQRHSGQDTIVVGTPMVNRNQVETENLIGYFLNNLALRTDLSGNPTFRELIGRIRKTTLAAYSHQDVPFEKVVQELSPKRDLSYSPIFQVFFNMTTEAMESRFDLEGIDGEPHISADSELESKFDFTLYLNQKASHIDLRLVYKTSLFTHDRMEAMLDQYLHLLDYLLENPDSPIQQASLVTHKSRQVLPNPTKKLDDSWQGAVFEALTKHAAQSPDQIAVQDPACTWTYDQLETQSNQLAHFLNQNNIGKGDVVAIYGHRSAPLVWAWMGILKSGAAFVNLDPAYPADRLQHYLDVSGASGLVCIPAAGKLPADLLTSISSFKINISLERADQFAHLPNQPPAVQLQPDDTAYIAFTSGSTGLPKGVRGRHGPLSHFLPWQIKTFSLTSQDRFSMLSGLSHDPLQRDIFTALWAGGTLVIPDPSKIGEPDYLSGWMAQQKITFAHMTPPMCQILTQSAAADTSLEQLRYVFFVGDKLTHQDMSQLQAIAPRVTGINSYGATETQRAVGFHLIPPQNGSTATARAKAVYPLGMGMPDVQLLVLNKHQQLAGIGESGELVVRSPHLAGGYLQNEQLSADRFLQNPFTQTPGDLIYKTGDLGRYRPDGTVEFAGRADRQFKIRGFRVEPGEIEHVLSTHPAVKDAVLVAQTGTTEETNTLAAYYTAEPAEPIPATELRNFVSNRLPNHMVPATFTFLRQVPLTPNGKIDFAQLPDPQKPQPVPNLSSINYQSETETRLAEIWCTLLDCQSIGRRANFFELGGHSLLAIRLFKQISETFEKTLPLTSLFQAPTLSRLAHLIDQFGEQLQDDPDSMIKNLVTIQAGSTTKKPPLFCVHGFGGGVLGYGELARLLGTDQPVFGLQAEGHDGLETPDTDIATMATRYIKSIQDIQPQGPYYLSGYCYGGVVAYEIAQQLEEQGQTVRFLGIFEGYAPLRGGNRESILQNPQLAAYWLKNLPYWFSDFVGLGRQQMMMRLRRRSRRNLKNFLARFGIELAVRPDDVVDDTADLTSAQLELMKVHLVALRQYNPSRLKSSVNLFRIRSHALTRVTDPTMGWHKLADQVHVNLISGSHNNILEQPHVASLANAIKTHI